MLSRFHVIPERYRQTDGQTDGQIGYINIARVSMLTCDKNLVSSLYTLSCQQSLLISTEYTNHLSRNWPLQVSCALSVSAVHEVLLVMTLWLEWHMHSAV